MAGSWDGTAEAYYASFARLCAGTVDALLASLLPASPGRRLLDAGSGPGGLAAAAQQAGFSVTGVDADESMTRLARRQHPTISFIRGALPHLPFATESFDAVAANFVVNHTPDPRASLRELGRVSKPGGHVGVTVWPGEVSPMNQLWNNVLSAASVQPPQGKTLPADKDFERTEAGLAEIVTGAGLDVVAIRTLQWSFCIDRDDLWLAVEGGIATIGQIYRAQTGVARSVMRGAYERLTDESHPDGKLRLPSSALMAVASRPSHQSLR